MSKVYLLVMVDSRGDADGLEYSVLGVFANRMHAEQVKKQKESDKNAAVKNYYGVKEFEVMREPKLNTDFHESVNLAEMFILNKR